LQAFVPPPLLEEPAEREGLQQLLETARQEGLSQGRREGWERARQEVTPLLQALRGALEELRSLRDRVMRELEGELVELALAIARIVVHRELTQGGIPPQLVKEALEALPRKGELVLRLNPADLEVLKRLGGKALEGVRVKEDQGMPRGGCVVEGELGRVDARPEVQIEEIARRLRERWRAST